LKKRQDSLNPGAAPWGSTSHQIQNNPILPTQHGTLKKSKPPVKYWYIPTTENEAVPSTNTLPKTYKSSVSHLTPKVLLASRENNEPDEEEKPPLPRRSSATGPAPAIKRTTSLLNRQHLPPPPIQLPPGISSFEISENTAFRDQIQRPVDSVYITSPNLRNRPNTQDIFPDFRFQPYHLFNPGAPQTSNFSLNNSKSPSIFRKSTDLQEAPFIVRNNFGGGQRDSYPPPVQHHHSFHPHPGGAHKLPPPPLLPKQIPPFTSSVDSQDDEPPPELPPKPRSLSSTLENQRSRNISTSRRQSQLILEQHRLQKQHEEACGNKLTAEDLEEKRRLESLLEQTSAEHGVLPEDLHDHLKTCRCTCSHLAYGNSTVRIYIFLFILWYVVVDMFGATVKLRS